MRSDAIVIVGVRLQDSTQMHLAQDNDVVHSDLICGRHSRLMRLFVVGENSTRETDHDGNDDQCHY